MDPVWTLFKRLSLTSDENLRVAIGSIPSRHLAALRGNTGEVGVAERSLRAGPALPLDVPGDHGHPLLRGERISSTFFLGSESQSQKLFSLLTGGTLWCQGCDPWTTAGAGSDSASGSGLAAKVSCRSFSSLDVRGGGATAETVATGADADAAAGGSSVSIASSTSSAWARGADGAVSTAVGGAVEANGVELLAGLPSEASSSSAAQRALQAVPRSAFMSIGPTTGANWSRFTVAVKDLSRSREELVVQA